MIKPWDNSLKALIRINPQAFVDWLVPGAQFVRERRETLKNCELEMDALLHTTVNDENMLLQVEFQTYNDATMPERLLRYNIIARWEHELPVLSCVIYLLQDGEIKISPLNWQVPTGQEVLQFHFKNIEVGKLMTEDILQTGKIGLLPLLPLTRDGATREVVKQMLTALNRPEYHELAFIGFTLAALVFKRKNQENLNWLIRSFRQMHDILRESPIFQMVLEEGREEGREKGREEGRIRGTLQTLHQSIINIIRARFPSLEEMATKQIPSIQNTTQLHRLIVEIALVQDIIEAHKLLLSQKEERR